MSIFLTAAFFLSSWTWEINSRQLATPNFMFFIWKSSLSHDLYACKTVLSNSIQRYMKHVILYREALLVNGCCYHAGSQLQKFIPRVLLIQILCSFHENSQERVLYILVKFHEFWDCLAVSNRGLNTGGRYELYWYLLIFDHLKD